MFQNIAKFGHKQNSEILPAGQTVSVEMPAGFEGRSVTSCEVMTSLLWQQYGLDLLHPEFNRWLERYAPDVKYITAQNKNIFTVGPDKKIKVNISPAIDQRLREVSSKYILWQVESEMEEALEIVEYVYLKDLNQQYDLAHAC
ncbi:MAG: hypothetical protein J2P31_02950 [Blastocatellia bacterium]|nr:hypothetical protein [Blastocatellia bacterium]